MLTRDRGQHWTAVRGLPDFARVVADRVDAQRFYALDFGRPRIAVSNDGGRVCVHRKQWTAQTCMRTTRAAEDPWPLLATAGRVEIYGWSAWGTLPLP